MECPLSVRRAGGLVSLEGGALCIAGVAYAGSGLVGHPENRLATVLAGMLAALAAVGLLASGRGLRRNRSVAWSPAVLAQLLFVVVAVGLLQGRIWVVGGPLLLVALAVLYLLATPAARAAYRAQG